MNGSLHCLVLSLDYLSLCRSVRLTASTFVVPYPQLPHALSHLAQRHLDLVSVKVNECARSDSRAFIHIDAGCDWLSCQGCLFGSKTRSPARRTNRRARLSCYSR